MLDGSDSLILCKCLISVNANVNFIYAQAKEKNINKFHI